VDPADEEPRVAAASSAFADSNSNGADAPGAPSTQSMTDDDGDGAREEQGAHNGSRLNLPPALREAFEKRKAELLRQHPDLLHRGISNDVGIADGGICPRLDHLFLLLLLALAVFLLHAEYGINVLGWCHRAIVSALSPGPIQRGDEPQGDNPAGRDAMQAALERARQVVLDAATRGQQQR